MDCIDFFPLCKLYYNPLPNPPHFLPAVWVSSAYSCVCMCAGVCVYVKVYAVTENKISLSSSATVSSSISVTANKASSSNSACEWEQNKLKYFCDWEQNQLKYLWNRKQIRWSISWTENKINSSICSARLLKLSQFFMKLWWFRLKENILWSLEQRKPVNILAHNCCWFMLFLVFFDKLDGMVNDTSMS